MDGRERPIKTTQHHPNSQEAIELTIYLTSSVNAQTFTTNLEN